MDFFLILFISLFRFQFINFLNLFSLKLISILFYLKKLMSFAHL